MRSWLLLAFAACGSPSTGPDAGSQVTDQRVAVPDPDPAWVDLVTPEVVVEPGAEAIYCNYLDNTAGRFGTDRIETLTSAGNHHLALRRPAVRRPSGTVELCTSGGEQAALELGDWFLGGGALPAGWAVELAADAQFVIETHYVNATDTPILLRDVVRIHRADDASVTRWVHPMHLKTYDLVVGPGATSLSFDCTAPADLSLFEFWGHEHGLGTGVRVEIGAPKQMLYRARWGVDPLIQGTTATPIAIARGATFTVTCDWTNPGGAVRYPDEMCAFGGYVTGAEFTCAGAARL